MYVVVVGCNSVDVLKFWSSLQLQSCTFKSVMINYWEEHMVSTGIIHKRSLVAYTEQNVCQFVSQVVNVKLNANRQGVWTFFSGQYLFQISYIEEFLQKKALKMFMRGKFCIAVWHGITIITFIRHTHKYACCSSNWYSMQLQ
jgi:hypothetical protein